MRVLFLTHRLPYPPNRGDRIRSFRLLSHLAAHATVDLLSLVHSDEEAAQADGVRSVARRVELARVSRVHNAWSALAALPSGISMTHALLDSPELGACLERLCSPAPPDVVLAYCSGMARLALEPPLAGVPFALDMVDVDSEKWRALSTTSAWPMRWVYAREARLLRAFERTASARARVTFVVNARERESMLDVNSTARVDVLSNGIDVTTFRPRETTARMPDVVFAGVFNYQPNEQAALWFARDVWPRVRAVRPDATFTLVGMNPSRAVRALDGQHGIRVTGTVPDVRPYLWSASVSVAPLLVARGLQNKVLEAVAAGLPCVVTPQVADGLPPEVGSACRVAADPSAFAGAVLELLGLAPGEGQAMAATARLEQMSWDQRLAPLMAALAG
ncbi:MAG: TIGR03087 family PEP-CTERM/XrtA system glycosyltransferase [Vicinamibacterales bacterium]